MPKATAVRWLKDDAELMAKKGKQGVSGTPYYKVEKEVRNRKTLPCACLWLMCLPLYIAHAQLGRCMGTSRVVSRVARALTTRPQPQPAP